MIINGKRKSGTPIILQNGKSNPLKRIALDGNVFNEKWLQQLIHDSPDILPVKDIDAGFSPMLPIGKEVFTKAGYIDNLYISDEGNITIVETKLWRNPEARREVVGQIIDYAKELSKWTFSDLDNAVKNYNQLLNNNSDGLLATLNKTGFLDDKQEQDYIDNVSRNLKRGRFLLLVVGDGIKESVEEMVEYLSQHPQLYFTLALVELQVFEVEGSTDRVIIPQLVTRTKEIERAIIRIEGVAASDVKISIETDLGMESISSNQPGSLKTTINEQEYFEQLESNCGAGAVALAKRIIADAEAMGLFIEWRSGSFSVRLPDPLGSGLKMSLLNVDRSGLFYIGIATARYQKLGVDMEIIHSFARDTAPLLPGIVQSADKPYLWNKYSELKNLHPVYDKFMLRLEQHTVEIKNLIEQKKELADNKELT
ncbi:MAG: hypothetical protein EOP48_18925 [Sphingobacteriales bacterium]|nr:MAG: hypothetical protein EOP48_18925 [Sphingobacteriales bacterium]